MSSECKKMQTKKYMNRASPPYSANKCKGKLKPGNDGIMYESVPDKNNVHKWVKAVRKSRKTSRKASRKSRKVSRKSRKASRKTSRKVSRKTSRKASRKSRKASRKTSRKVSRKTSRKASRKSRKASRKTSRKTSRKSRNLKKKYNCPRAETNKREDLVKELKCHVRNWERITGISEDLSDERIKSESVSSLKNHLKFYRDNNPYDMM